MLIKKTHLLNSVLCSIILAIAYATLTVCYYLFYLGRTGRYTLIEKWRDTERHLAPHENPIISLNKWGQYASDVQLILRRTGPSLSERPTSDSVARIPERTLYRQSLPPLAKLRPQIDK